MRKIRYTTMYQTTNISGSLLFNIPIVNAVVSPQPPQTLNSTPQNDAQDWAKRSSGPMVVFAHNFTSASEVNQFRVTYGNTVNDPTSSLSQDTTWNASDGFAGGGSLQIAIRTGHTSSDSGWWRPTSAIKSGNNGLSANDPAASGTVPVQSWNSGSPSQYYNWQVGGYMAAAEIAKLRTAEGLTATAEPYWPTPGKLATIDGTEFWLSIRVKISGSRWTAGNPSGKLLFINTMAATPLQEILVTSLQGGSEATWGMNFYRTQPFIMYTGQFRGVNAALMPTYQGYNEPSNGTPLEGGPLSPYQATCLIGSQTNAGACWEYPADQWTTLLFHVIPGQDNKPVSGTHFSGTGAKLSDWPYADTAIEVFKCDLGENKWTQLNANDNLKWWYDSSGISSSGNGPAGTSYADQYFPPWFNGIQPSGYMNTAQPVSVAGWTQKFTQIIFSKDYIPPPGQTAPSWWTGLAPGAWSAIPGTDAAGSIGQHIPSPVPGTNCTQANYDGESTSTFNDSTGPRAIADTWCGSCVDQINGNWILLGNGGHSDYFGNEGYMCSLRSGGATSNGWKRFIDPTPDNMLWLTTNFNNGGNYNGIGVNKDNRPRSDHTAAMRVYGDGQIWSGMQSAMASGGGSGNFCIYSFNLQDSALRAANSAGNSLAWTNSKGPYQIDYLQTPANGGSIGGSAAQFGCGCFDRYGHRAWFASGEGGGRTNCQLWSIQTLGPNIGQLNLYNLPDNYASFPTMVVCHDLNIMVGFDAKIQRIIVFDLNSVVPSTGTINYTSIIPSGSGQYGGWSGPNGISEPFIGSAYIVQNNVIAVGDPKLLGATIWRLQVPTTIDSHGRKVYNPSGTWTWLSTVGSGVTPQFAGAKTYSLFNYIEDMGDGNGGILFIGGVDTPSYIYKIGSGGI